MTQILESSRVEHTLKAGQAKREGLTCLSETSAYYMIKTNIVEVKYETQLYAVHDHHRC